VSRDDDDNGRRFGVAVHSADAASIVLAARRVLHVMSNNATDASNRCCCGRRLHACGGRASARARTGECRAVAAVAFRGTGGNDNRRWRGPTGVRREVLASAVRDVSVRNGGTSRPVVVAAVKGKTCVLGTYDSAW